MGDTAWSTVRRKQRRVHRSPVRSTTLELKSRATTLCRSNKARPAPSRVTLLVPTTELLLTTMAISQSHLLQSGRRRLQRPQRERKVQHPRRSRRREASPLVLLHVKKRLHLLLDPSPLLPRNRGARSDRVSVKSSFSVVSSSSALPVNASHCRSSQQGRRENIAKDPKSRTCTLELLRSPHYPILTMSSAKASQAVVEIAQTAKEAFAASQLLDASARQQALVALKHALTVSKDEILAANALDMKVRS